LQDAAEQRTMIFCVFVLNEDKLRCYCGNSMG